MRWEVKYQISTWSHPLVSGQELECLGGYEYLIVRRPWPKSRGRPCSCSPVNWLDYSVVGASTGPRLLLAASNDCHSTQLTWCSPVSKMVGTVMRALKVPL